MGQGVNRFKELIDSRMGDPAILKKTCAEAMGVSWQKVNRMYNGESAINVEPEKLVLLLTWANGNKVVGAPDWTLEDLVSPSILETSA